MSAKSNFEEDIRGFQVLHAKSLPFFRGLLIVYILLGATCLIAAYIVPSNWQLPSIFVGCMAMAMAIFPWLSMRNHQERIDGLNVLIDEWVTIERAGDKRPGAKDNLITLLWSIYDNNKSGK